PPLLNSIALAIHAPKSDCVQTMLRRVHRHVRKTGNQHCDVGNDILERISEKGTIGETSVGLNEKRALLLFLLRGALPYPFFVCLVVGIVHVHNESGLTVSCDRRTLDCRPPGRHIMPNPPVDFSPGMLC